VRTGLYSPVNIKMEKCKQAVGYEIISRVFTRLALEREITEPLAKLPHEYEDKVFRELNYGPVEGKFGYLIFKNDSRYDLEQELQLDIIGADIVWPKEAAEYERFNMVTEANSGTSLVLFRK